MKAYEEVKVSLLPSGLDGGEWLDPRPGRFIPGTPLDRGPGGYQRRSGHCGEEKNILPCRESNPSRPAGSQTLYRLSYPGATFP
jgi:hypothetical protein